MAIVINGSTGISGVNGSASAPALQGSDTNTGVYYGTDIISLSTNGTSRLYIDSSGNVGIGTSSPGAKLSVVSTGANVTGIEYKYDDTYQRFVVGLNNYNTYIAAKSGADTQTVLISTIGDSYLNGGNVGIGTSSPQAKFDVWGNAQVRNADNTQTTLSLLNGTAYNSSTLTNFIIGSHNSDSVDNGRTYRFNIGISGTALGKSLTFSTVDTTNGTLERMRIGSDGLVTVGNTTTSSGEIVTYSPVNNNSGFVSRTSTTGTTSKDAYLYLENHNGSNYPYAYLAIPNPNTNVPYLSFASPGVTSGTSAFVEAYSGTYTSGLGFQANGGFTATGEGGIGAKPAYFARAWVNFNGTGTVAIRASGNVSSITDVGVGVYTVNFTTAMPDTNFAASLGGSQDNFAAATNSDIGTAGFTTSSVTVACRNTADTAYVDYAYVTISIFR